MLVLLVCTKTPSEDSPAPDELHSVGTVARIRQSTKNGTDKAPSVRFICECRQRATVKEYYKTGDLITASVMAKALPDGVQDTYFETVKQHNESIKASALAEALKQQPKPTPGGVPQGADPELERMLRGAGLK